MKKLTIALSMLYLFSGSLAFAAKSKGDMTLYYKPGACSFASRVIINELGLKSDFEAVDLTTHTLESNKANYYDINEKGSVPALKLGNGELLTESAAIMQYLADKDSKNKMLPAVGKMERYRVLEMISMMTMDIHKVVALIFRAKLSDVDKANLMNSLKKSYSFVDKKLAGKKYLVGDNFTIADAYLFTILNWMPRLKIDLSEFKNLESFYNTHKTRPSIALALTQEGLNK